MPLRLRGDGEDRTECPDIVPAQLRVIVTVRPKYACRRCGEGVTRAPARLIEGGLPTEGAITHVLISKYADHCPLHRQARICARPGLKPDRSTPAGGVGKAVFHLGPVYGRLKAALKTSGTPGPDETTVRVLDPGRGKTKTGYMWTMVRDERSRSGADPPGWSMSMRPGAAASMARSFSMARGTVRTDGHSGHNRPARPDRPGGALTPAGCRIHARRGAWRRCR